MIYAGWDSPSYRDEINGEIAINLTDLDRSPMALAGRPEEVIAYCEKVIEIAQAHMPEAVR